MILAVENANLSKELKKIGYTTKSISYNGYVDAILIEENSISSMEMSVISCPTLVINTKGKTTSEIDFILKTKLYSPLF